MINIKTHLKILILSLLIVTQYFFCGNLAYAHKNIQEEIKLGKQLETSSFDYSTLKNLGDLYCDKEDFLSALLYYKKAIDINPKEADINKLGQIYYVIGDYKNALKCFETALKLNPKNERTQIKIEITKNQIDKIKENEKINQLEPKETAPKEIHALIKIEGRLKDTNSEEKLHKIINFIWSDPQGKVLLQTIYNVQANLYIKRNIKNSYFTCYQTLPMTDAYEYNQVLKNSLAYSINIEKRIYIKESDISRFQEKNTTLPENLSSIMVVTHELCHFIKFLGYPKSAGTKQEELICYVVGFDLASRVLTGESLTDNEIKMYTSKIYNSMRHNSYKQLVNDDDVARKMTSVGIYVPKYYLYNDISKLDYKGMKNNTNIQNYVNTLNTYLSKNYESVFSNKKINYISSVVLRNNGEVNIFSFKKSTNYLTKEDQFNIKVAQFMEYFPCDYANIPITYTRNNNNLKMKIYY